MENEHAVLTLKGPRTGATAAEHEFPVDVALAHEALDRPDLPAVEKTRHLWRGEDGHLWEIDEFEGPLAGLIIAEVELPPRTNRDLPAFWALKSPPKHGPAIPWPNSLLRLARNEAISQSDGLRADV